MSHLIRTSRKNLYQYLTKCCVNTFMCMWSFGIWEFGYDWQTQNALFLSKRRAVTSSLMLQNFGILSSVSVSISVSVSLCMIRFWKDKMFIWTSALKKFCCLFFFFSSACWVCMSKALFSLHHHFSLFCYAMLNWFLFIQSGFGCVLERAFFKYMK